MHRTICIACAKMVVLILVTFSLLLGCVTNPATGRSQFQVISPQRELELGRTGAPQFLEKGGGELPAPAVNQYVRDLGRRLADQCEKPELPWEFFALNSPIVNAFALPGGKVFVTRGLLEKLDSEAQLAGVLSHEIGHVTARHINDRMFQAYTVAMIGVGIGIAGAATDEELLRYVGLGTQIGGGLYLLSYDRNQEIESDELGVRYITKLGYNPVAQMQVMEVLQTAGGSGGGAMEILSTHPAPQTRLRRLKKHIAQYYPAYQDPGHYRFARDGYHRRVLDALKKLPPPPPAQQ